MTSSNTSQTEANDMAEIERNWKKVEHNVKVLGLGDGASSGKENKFQDYFDEGYSAGFRGGYNIGRIKGLLFSQKVQKCLALNEHQLLSKPKTGWCHTCAEKETSHKTVLEAMAHQEETNNKNLNELQKFYSEMNVDIQLSNVL